MKNGFNRIKKKCMQVYTKALQYKTAYRGDLYIALNKMKFI